MNWLLFPDTSGVPSSNAASAFQSFSNDGVPPVNPTAASKRVRIQRCDARIEIERAARAFA